MEIEHTEWKKGELYIYIKKEDYETLKNMEYEDEFNRTHEINIEDILDHIADETGVFIIEV